MMDVSNEHAVERNAASSYPPYYCAPSFYVEQVDPKTFRPATTGSVSIVDAT